VRRLPVRLLHRAQQIIEIARLADGLWQVHSVLVLVWLTFRHSPRPLALHITTPSGSKRRFYLTEMSQAKALREVFVAGAYSTPIEGSVRTIIDLGANAGQSAIYFRDRFPEARIISVEADPDVASLVERNMAGDPNHTVVTAAVTDHGGTVALTRAAGHSWGSNVLGAQPSSKIAVLTARLKLPKPRRARRSREMPSLQVRSMTLPTLMGEHQLERVDLVKVDIEGAEMLVLEDAEVLARITWVLGELHPTIVDRSAEDMMASLRTLGAFTYDELRPGDVFALGRP
jgi:FkbM family methyltransferase